MCEKQGFLLLVCDCVPFSLVSNLSLRLEWQVCGKPGGTGKRWWNSTESAPAATQAVLSAQSRTVHGGDPWHWGCCWVPLPLPFQVPPEAELRECRISGECTEIKQLILRLGELFLNIIKFIFCELFTKALYLALHPCISLSGGKWTIKEHGEVQKKAGECRNEATEYHDHSHASQCDVVKSTLRWNSRGQILSFTSLCAPHLPAVCPTTRRLTSRSHFPFWSSVESSTDPVEFSSLLRENSVGNSNSRDDVVVAAVTIDDDHHKAGWLSLR